MPIYEFKCNACAHIFDELVPMSTTGDSLKCPKCGNVGAKKSRGSWLNATHGLENGHIAVGQKLSGKGSSRTSSDTSSSESSTASAAAAAS